MSDRLSMKEIGERINAHLKRFEADRKINIDRSQNKTGLYTYYKAGAHGIARWVYVCYVTYQGNTPLKRPDALKYLAWLDAGNVGKHYETLGRR